MAPRKKSKPKKKSAKKVAVDPNIEEIYEETIEFHCPKRGLVKQKVKVRKFKTRCIDTVDILKAESDIIDKIEEADDGLSIYSEEDLSKEE